MKKQINSASLGGWLIPIQIFIILNAISWIKNLQIFYNLLSEKQTLINQKPLDMMKLTEFFIYYELAVSLIFSFFSFAVFYYFFKRNKLFPILMITYLILEIILETVSLIIFRNLYEDYNFIIQKFIFTIVIASLIILYLLKSERVKLTFIH